MAATDPWKKLREPFPADKIKTKPGRGKSGRPLSYISHGLITERLNDADPNWSSDMLSEHVYRDEHGRLHCEGVTIALTVNGVRRVEAGGPQRQDGFANEIKNAYSDALKRAAMRFGVALEMWESLVDAEDDEDYAAEAYVALLEAHREPPAPQRETAGTIRDPDRSPPSQVRVQDGVHRPPPNTPRITEKQAKYLWVLARQVWPKEPGMTIDPADVTVHDEIARKWRVEHVTGLTSEQARVYIDRLKGLLLEKEEQARQPVAAGQQGMSGMPAEPAHLRDYAN